MTATLPGLSKETTFIYQGFQFICGVDPVGPELFQPRVMYESGLPGVAATPLQDDAAPYRTMAEAQRHAEQQAIRWVHDRQGDSAGRM